ncbi:MAG: GspH/FimT family pseudopilin [Terriglobales bacterium]
MKRFTTKRSMQGFSLIEVLIVVSITLTVAGMAVPKMMTTLADLGLSGGVHSAAGLIQQARMDAIKNNKFRKVRYANSATSGRVFIDYNDNSQPDSNEPQVQLGNAVLAYSTPTGVPALSTTDLGYTTVTTTAVGWNPVGFSCSSSTTCAVGMVMYFTDTRAMGTPGWAAVAVAPGGRVQCWVWNGSAWKQQ